MIIEHLGKAPKIAPSAYVAPNPDGHLKIPHLWPGQNPPPKVRFYPLSDRAK